MTEDRAGQDDKSPAESRVRRKLRRAALAYLNRYAVSEAHFAAVLKRKLGRWAQLGLYEAGAIDPARLTAEVVAEFSALGLVDDSGFAEGKVAALRARGASRRKIAFGLAAKGVAAETVAAALASADLDEKGAALRFCRRRRIGPFRGEGRVSDRDAVIREIAALARQGFAYALARDVIGMDRQEAEARLDVSVVGDADGMGV